MQVEAFDSFEDAVAHIDAIKQRRVLEVRRGNETILAWPIDHPEAPSVKSPGSLGIFGPGAKSTTRFFKTALRLVDTPVSTSDLVDPNAEKPGMENIPDNLNVESRMHKAWVHMRASGRGWKSSRLGEELGWRPGSASLQLKKLVDIGCAQCNNPWEHAKSRIYWATSKTPPYSSLDVRKEGHKRTFDRAGKEKAIIRAIRKGYKTRLEILHNTKLTQWVVEDTLRNLLDTGRARRVRVGASYNYFIGGKM